MVAVVTGNSLGLVGSSGNVLGSSGQLGNAVTGLGGDLAYVNAATGNLSIQRQDELLLGLGPDIGIVRTYNSQGTFDFDNNDNWQISLYRRVFGLTGGTGVNTAGSTVKRTAADGAELTYTYDTATAKYINKDGAGSYDTLTFASNTWTWQDGDSRIKETYEVQTAGATAAEGTHRIKTLTDTDGNALTYTYNNATDSLITQVTSTNGERTELIYNATKQLTQINVVNSDNVTTTRVRYTYENATATARLTSVSTDLTPANTADAVNYTTTYTYHPTNTADKKIYKITNSDGTNTSFTYDGSGRVLTVTDGTGNVTTFAYPTTTTATITNVGNNGVSQVTTLTYDVNKQLTRVQGPSGSGQDINYLYDANGNVTQMTDSRGNVTKYTYDANGNQTRQEDAAGNTTTRSYSATNQLLTETTYVTPDTVPGDVTYNAALPQTTRYAYDVEEHLRFIVSPEGRVTEYRYNTNGTRAATIQYTENLFGSAATADETTLNAWVTTTVTDKTKTQRTDYSYDVRGQLSARTTYSTVTSTGLGVVDSNTSTTQYVYDQYGNLTQKIDARAGVSPSTGTGPVAHTPPVATGLTVAHYADTPLIDSGVAGNVTSYEQAIETSTPTTTSVYSDAVVANAQSDEAYRMTGYVYMEAGHDYTFSGYRDDTLILKIGGITLQSDAFDTWGDFTSPVYSPVVTGYYSVEVDFYNAGGVGSIDLNLSIDGGSAQGFNTTNFKIYASADDFIGQAGVGEQVTVNDGSYFVTQATNTNPPSSSGTEGYLTSYSYDGLNRLTSQTDALGNITTTIYNDTIAGIVDGGTNIAANSTAVRLANGLVTINTYDLAGRLISSTNTNAANAVLGTTTYLYDKLGQLRQSTDATGQSSYYLYDTLGRKVGVIDANRNLTEYVYNNNNQVIRTIQYAAAVTASLTAATALTNTIATAGIRISTPATDRVTRNVYDKAGRLTKQVDALNFVTEYQYDGASRLIKTIQYHGVGTIGAATGLNGELLPANVTVTPDATKDRITRQLYSDDGLLVAKLDAEGYLTEYLYDGVGQHISTIRYGTQTASAQWANGDLAALRPATAANDQKTYNIYNARGQLEGSVDPLGYLTEYQYDVAGNLTNTVRYATAINYTLGASVAASRPAANAEDQSTTNTYDGNNRIKSTTSSPDGLSTEYTYDSVGNLTQQVNTYTGAANTEKRSQFKQYDLLGRVTRALSGEGILALQALVSPTQTQIDTVWDSYGTRYTYDLAGRVIVATAPNGTNATGNKTLYYYDTEGKLRYQVNAVGEVTEFIYSKFDQRTATRQYKTRITAATLASMQTVANTATTGVVSTTVNTAANTALTALNTGVASYVETLTTYDNAGRAISFTDALLNVNSRTYNAFGELFTATNKLDASNNVITSYTYDKRGLVTMTTEDAAGINRITQAVYDAFGRITQTTDGRNNIVQYSYDKLGREVTVTDALTTQTQTTYDAFSRVLTRRDGRGVAGNYNTVSYVYDTANRRMTMTTSEGISLITEKNRYGETVKVTDGRNHITTYTYNADGQLKTSTTDTGTATSPTTSTTANDYDAAGHLITTTDARGTQTTLAYDAANRVMSRVVDPTGLNLKTEYRYDALGRQTWVKDAKGIWTRTDYDNKGQVASIVVDPTSIPTTDVNGLVTGTTANAAGLNITTNFTYDARGKRLTVVEGAGTASAKTTQYVYDKLGRLTQNIVDPGAGKLNITTAYTYDKNDNVVLKTDANGNKTVYTYDANNRLVYTVDALGNVTKNDYDANGNVITTTAYASATTTVLTTLQAAPTTTPIAVSDANTSNRISRNVYDKDSRSTFSMDALGYVTKYEYDANGNVTKTTQYANAVVTPATGVAPALVATAGTSNYLITDAVKDRVTQASYDAANRLIESQDGLGIITQYTYDANGNQLSVKEGVGTASERTTYQAFDAANRKISATDGEGHQTQTSYDGLGNIITVTDALGHIGYFYYDAVGRMTLQVNPEGAVTETKYDALGNQTDIIRYSNKVIGTLSVGTRPVIGGTTGTYVTINANADQLQKVTYDAAGRKLTIKTAFANIGGQTLDTSNTATQNAYIESFTYDAFSNVLTSTARNGAVTTYAYDVLNRKKTETLPITSKNASNVSVAVQNSFAYDAFGNLVTKTEAVDLPEQRVTTYTYTLNNLQSTESMQVYLSGSQTSVSATKARTYDTRGNVTSETDANGNISYYYYDLQNRRTGMVDANNVLTTYAYDAVGNKSSQTTYANKISNPEIGTTPNSTIDAANDRTTYYTYDAVGRELTSEIRDMVVGTVNTSNDTYNALNTSTLTQTTQYDENGNIIKVTDANDNSVRAYYNLAGEKVAEVDAAGYLTTWTRDAYGNVATETKYAKRLSDATSPLTVTDSTTLAQINATAATLGTTPSATVTGDRATNYTYDRLNRVLVEAKLSVAQGTVNTSNGQLTQTTAAATTSYVYDGLNNITQKTNAVGGITNWTYDGLGRRTNQSDPVFTDNTGNTAARSRTDMVYDGLNNLTRVVARGANDAVETDDEITTYSYSTGGRLISETDALGAVVSYGYDLNGNVLQKTLKNRRTADQILANQVTGVDDVTTYTYDSVNRQLNSTVVNTNTNSNTTNAVEYNSFGEVVGKSTYVGTAPSTADEFAIYDRAGRVFKTNSEDGVVKVMLYDKNGNVTMRLTSSDNSTSNINTIQNTASALSTLIFAAPNTLQTMSVYDNRNQLTKTIQAAMDANRQIGEISTSVGTTTVDMTNPLTNSVSEALPPNPISAGSIGSGGGEISWTMSISTGAAAVGGYAGKSGFLANIEIDIPDSVAGALGGDSLRVYTMLTINNNGNEIWYNAYSGYGAQGSKVVMPKLYIGNDLVDRVVGISFVVYKSVGSEEVVVATASKTGNLLGGSYTYYPVTQTGMSMSGPIYTTSQFPVTTTAVKNSSGEFDSFDKLYIADQPYGTNRVLLSYRLAGSTTPATTISMSPVMNAKTPSTAVDGLYSFDWKSIPAGLYEFSYAAMNANGEILNQQSGTFSTVVGSGDNLVTMNPAPAVTYNPVKPITQNDNALVKTGGTDAVWDADAFSRFSVTGSAYVSAKAGQINKHGMIGLNSDPMTNASYASIDYAWYAHSNGNLYIYENGTNVLAVGFGTYTTSDVLAVEYNGTTVKYLKNGVVMHTSTTTADRTFYMDSSFYSKGFTFNEVQFGATKALAFDIVLNNDNALVKTSGADAWGAADAFSKTSVTGSAYVSARVGQTNMSGMIALNSDPMTDKSYTSLDYAWHPSNSTLYIYESGVNIGTFGTYVPSDVLAIEYSGTTVKYLKNGVVMHTSTTTADRTFYMDSSFYQTGFTFNNVKFGATEADATDIVLNDDNALVKTGGTNAVWNADAYTKTSTVGSAYVSARAGQTNKSGMIALNSDPLTNKSYTSLDYAWYAHSNGNLYIYESGTNVLAAGYGVYTPSDILAIEYSGTSVNYLKNGVVIKSSTTTAGHTFYMDSSFYELGFTFNNIKFGTSAITATEVLTGFSVSQQAGILIGGLGRAFISNAASTGLTTNGLQLVDQGTTADNITLKYRVKDSGGTWSTINSNSFVKSAATAEYGLGHFSLSTANMGVFANNTTYEVELEVRDSAGKLLRISSTEISRDANGVFNADMSLSLNKIRLGGEPATATYMDVSYRPLNSTIAYSAPVRIYATEASSGAFDWDITGVPPGNQDVNIISYDSSDMVLNQYQANIKFGVNSAIVNSIASLNNPHFITISPPNPNSVDYIVAGYRLKGSAVEYTMLPMSTYVINGNGERQFQVAIPVLNNGEYEYTYTAYGADTESYVDPESITITPPSDTQATQVVNGSGSGTSTIYQENFNGVNPVVSGAASAYGYENGNLYIADSGTTNGRLMINNGSAATDGWPTFQTNNSIDYAAGQTFRTEVTLGADSAGRNFRIGLEGDTGFLFASFIGNDVGSDGTGWDWHSGTITTNNNTTYVVEIELNATGQTLYVYEKGLTRADGWIDVRQNGAWGSYVISGTTSEGPNTTLSENSIDNVSVTEMVSAPTTSAVQAKYALKVGEGVTPNWIDVTSTEITATDGSKQYRLNLPEPLPEGEYIYEYKTYTLVTDIADPNYNTYQWSESVQGSFVSTIKTNELVSNIGAFNIDATNITNTQDKWTWIGSNSTLATIARQQSYNAFGEIASETDGRGNTTEYTYNALGKLTRKQDPNVSITSQDGSVAQVAPVTQYTYDAIGRMVGVTDANNNTNTQTWIAAGANGEDVVSNEYHADTGIRTRKYDRFGNLASETDEVGRTTTYLYDKDNQLIAVTHPSGVINQYSYDEAGQRVAHTNAYNDVEKTYYDSLGRITQTKSNMGFATSYSYTYTTNVIGLGGATVSGWINTTTDAVGRTVVDTTDMFNHTFTHKDLGNHIFNYSYNEAGWLMSQTGTSGQKIVYDHYNNGYIKSIHDKALGMYTFYEYDKDGNKAFEGYVSLKDPSNIANGYEDYFQQATLTYDALNRLTKVEDPRATITYAYDAVGNRRMVHSQYKNGVDGALTVQEYWYKYDSMNRFLITKGTFDVATNTIKRGNEGNEISYDLAGQRKVAINGVDGTTEAYDYNADGYLTDIKINGTLRSTRTNDLLGRTTKLTEYATNGTTVSYRQTTTYDKDNRTLTQSDNSGNKTWFYYYNDAADNNKSQTGAGELARTFSDSDGNGNTGDGTIINTYYNYEYWDESKITAITADPYNRAIKKSNNKWANGYSDISYDVNGHISGAVDRQGNRNFRYISDAQGIVLLRDEITGAIERPNYRYYGSTYNAGSVTNKVERFYYVDGVAVGGVGNDGPSRVDYVQSMANRNAPKGNYAGWKPVASADFDQNYEPISPTYPGAVSSTYVVRNGDTLQSIALQVWGDSAMWYLIADANGLASGQVLEPNMALIIPNKVTNIHNNAGTFRPYNPGEAIGDLNPTIPAMPKPPKKKHGCGGLGMVIAAIVTVVATIYTAGALTAAAGSNFGAIMSAGVTTLGGGTAIGGAALGFGEAAFAGAVGSVAGQLTGMALGVQDKFSWSAVATSALSTVIGTKAPTFYNGEGSAGIALNAAAKNIIGQGVGIITGAQKGFSWSSVAVSAIAAPISSKVNKELFGFSDIQGMRTATSAAQNRLLSGLSESAISSAVTELTRVTLEGGKLSWNSIAVNTATSFTYKAFDDPVSRNVKYAAAIQERGVPIVVDENSLLHYYSSNVDGVHVSKDGEYTKELLSYRDGNQEVQTVAADSFMAQNAIAMGYEHVSAKELYFGDTKLATYYGTPQTWIDTTSGLTLGDVPNSFQRQVAIDGRQSPELQAVSDKYIDSGSGQVNPLLWSEFTSATMQAGLSMVITTNGLGNFYQQARDNARGLAENNKSVVINIYNATTDGLFYADSLINAIPRQLNEGFSTNQAVIQTQLKEAIAYNKKLHGDEPYLTKFISHSEGTIEGNLAVDRMDKSFKDSLHVINVGTASWHRPENVGRYDNIYDKNDAVTNLTHGYNLAKDTEFNHEIDMDYYGTDTSESPQHHSFYLYLYNQEARNIMELNGRPSIISRPF